LRCRIATARSSATTVLPVPAAVDQISSIVWQTQDAS
jgi:hypothetical protein